MASRDGHDAIARATRESMQVVKFVHATKSSVEALEKVTVLDDNNSCLEVEECRICLETLSTGGYSHALFSYISWQLHCPLATE